MDKIYLSVVIPSYNETENLRRGVLDEVKNYLSKQKYTWEVIVSDDESPDTESRRLAKDFCDQNQGFIFLANKHGGKPLAVWSGIQKATGQLVLFADMDQSTPISELDKILPYFDKGFDVVIGSRGLERKKFSIFRKLASFVFRTFRRSIVLTGIVDTQAGFKCLKTKIAKEIFPMLAVIKSAGTGVKGWTVSSFDVEMLFIVERRGYKIAEVPILWEDKDESVAKAKERQGGKFIKESIEMFQEVLRVKINQLRGLYDK
ncbi:MAG: glycosyltransferase [Patescibacteria group bacterium]